MKRNGEIKLEALSRIDEDIIDANTEKRALLIKNQKKRRKRMIRTIAISAACLVLVIGVVLGLIPTMTAGIPVYEGMSVSGKAPTLPSEEESASGATPMASKIIQATALSKKTTLHDAVFVDDDDDDDDHDDDDDRHWGDHEDNGGLTYDSEEGVYYAEPNQDVYITVHINNPSKYEILSFTLNGVKYSSYMFEDGSDLENLVLKYNVGEEVGTREYTIDEIKYVKGEKIKNVIMGGDRTVRVMVRPEDLVKTEGLDSIVDLSLIKTHYGIEKFDALSIYENGTLVRSADTTTGRLGKLPFNKEYMLVGEYTANGKKMTFELPFQSPKTSTGLLIVDGKVTGIGTCTDSTLYIDLPVADNAFKDRNTQIKRVYFGEGATSIGSYAFYGCSLLEEVVLSGTLTEIKDFAFARCDSLQSIALPNSLKKMGAGAFSGEKLNAIHISSLESYLDITYANHSNPLASAKNLYLDGVLVTDLVIPDTVKSLKEGALAYCTSIKSITFPQGFEEIGPYALAQCSSLQSVSLEQGFKKIGEYAFERCSSLKSVSLKEIEEIAPYAFYNCTALEDINLPDTLSELGYWAFCNCTSLKSITIPASIKEIEVHTFMGCNLLQSVTLSKGLEIIGMAAFSGCISLESVTLPEGLTLIDDWAFYDCTSLKSVTISSGLKTIGNTTFGRCTSLKEIRIPESLETIRDMAFEECTSLKSVYITSLESWLNISFGYNMSNPLYYSGNLYLNDELVSKLVIPESVTELKKYAFAGCASITEAIIHDGVVAVSGSVFEKCTSLESIKCEPSSQPEGWECHDWYMGIVIWGYTEE